MRFRSSTFNHVSVTLKYHISNLYALLVISVSLLEYMVVKKLHLQGLNEFKVTDTKVCARHPKVGNHECKAPSEVFGSYVKMRLEHILCLIISVLVL